MNNDYIYTGTDKGISIKPLYYVGGYITYEIMVSNMGFSGIYNFCIFEEVVQDIVKNLQNMIEDLSGTINIKDSDSDAFINFTFGTEKTLEIQGQLGSVLDDNCLKFKLDADQTTLLLLKEKLLSY